MTHDNAVDYHTGAPLFADSSAAQTLRRWAKEAAGHAPRPEVMLGVDPGLRTADAFTVVDERRGRPARVEAMERVPEYIDGIAHSTTPHLHVHRHVLRDERHVLRDEEALLLDRDVLARTMKEAADNLARRLFADTPLALSSIIRTGIVPWDIEYQTTTDGATFERVTRLVEYERGARRG